MASNPKSWTCVSRWVHQEDGPTATEYAFLLALMVLAVVGSIVGASQAMQQVFAAATNTLTTAIPGG